MGVAALDTESAMRAFVAATGVNIFPNINDERGAVWAEYGIGYQPAFVFQRADGSTETFGSLSETDINNKVGEIFG